MSKAEIKRAIPDDENELKQILYAMLFDDKRFKEAEAIWRDKNKFEECCREYGLLQALPPPFNIIKPVPISPRGSYPSPVENKEIEFADNFNLLMTSGKYDDALIAARSYPEIYSIAQFLSAMSRLSLNMVELHGCLFPFLILRKLLVETPMGTDMLSVTNELKMGCKNVLSQLQKRFQEKQSQIDFTSSAEFRAFTKFSDFELSLALDDTETSLSPSISKSLKPSTPTEFSVDTATILFSEGKYDEVLIVLLKWSQMRVAGADFDPNSISLFYSAYALLGAELLQHGDFLGWVLWVLEEWNKQKKALSENVEDNIDSLKALSNAIATLRRGLLDYAKRKISKDLSSLPQVQRQFSSPLAKAVLGPSFHEKLSALFPGKGKLGGQSTNLSGKTVLAKSPTSSSASLLSTTPSTQPSSSSLLIPAHLNGPASTLETFVVDEKTGDLSKPMSSTTANQITRIRQEYLAFMDSRSYDAAFIFTLENSAHFSDQFPYIFPMMSLILNAVEEGYLFPFLMCRAILYFSFGAGDSRIQQFSKDFQERTIPLLTKEFQSKGLESKAYQFFQKVVTFKAAVEGLKVSGLEESKRGESAIPQEIKIVAGSETLTLQDVTPLASFSCDHAEILCTQQQYDEALIELLQSKNIDCLNWLGNRNSTVTALNAYSNLLIALLKKGDYVGLVLKFLQDTGSVQRYSRGVFLEALQNARTILQDEVVNYVKRKLHEKLSGTLADLKLKFGGFAKTVMDRKYYDQVYQLLQPHLTAERDSALSVSVLASTSSSSLSSSLIESTSGNMSASASTTAFSPTSRSRKSSFNAGITLVENMSSSGSASSLTSTPDSSAPTNDEQRSNIKEPS